MFFYPFLVNTILKISVFGRRGVYHFKHSGLIPVFLWCCMLLHYVISLVHFAFHWFCFVYRNCDIYFCFSSKWNYNFIFWNIFELPLVSICYTMSINAVNRLRRYVRHYNVNTLSDVLANIAGDTIVQFLKEINLNIKL